jgi:hypothetical protein
LRVRSIFESRRRASASCGRRMSCSRSPASRWISDCRSEGYLYLARTCGLASLRRAHAIQKWLLGAWDTTSARGGARRCRVDLSRPVCDIGSVGPGLRPDCREPAPTRAQRDLRMAAGPRGTSCAYRKSRRSGRARLKIPIALLMYSIAWAGLHCQPRVRKWTGRGRHER